MLETSVETIKKLKKEGYGRTEIADRLKISIEEVQSAFDIIKSEPLRSGYFSAQIERKMEHNDTLKGIQTMLCGNVKYLWKMTRLLEMRKAHLEGVISEMEKYIKKGSEISDVFAEKGISLDGPLE